MEGAAAQHRAAALLARRGRADHHLRPAGHADAAVRRARWWRRRTSRRSRTSSRTSSRSSCTPEEAQKEAAKDLEHAQQQPQAQLDAAKVALNGDPNATRRRPAPRARSTPRRRRSRLRSANPRRRATTSSRATCKALETELDDAGAPPTTARPRRRRRVATFLTAADDYDDRGRGARVGAGVVRLAPERERRAAAVRAELRALPHARAGRCSIRRSPNSTRRARPARRRRRSGRRHRLQPARRRDRSAGSARAPNRARSASTPRSTSSRTGSEDHKQYGNGGIGTGKHAGLRRDADRAR